MKPLLNLTFCIYLVNKILFLSGKSQVILQIVSVVTMAENDTAAVITDNKLPVNINYIPSVGVHGGAHGTPVIIPECASDK